MSFPPELVLLVLSFEARGGAWGAAALRTNGRRGNLVFMLATVQTARGQQAAWAAAARGQPLPAWLRLETVPRPVPSPFQKPEDVPPAFVRQDRAYAFAALVPAEWHGDLVPLIVNSRAPLILRYVLRHHSDEAAGLAAWAMYCALGMKARTLVPLIRLNAQDSRAPLVAERFFSDTIPMGCYERDMRRLLQARAVGVIDDARVVRGLIEGEEWGVLSTALHVIVARRMVHSARAVMASVHAVGLAAAMSMLAVVPNGPEVQNLLKILHSIASASGVTAHCVYDALEAAKHNRDKTVLCDVKNMCYCVVTHGGLCSAEP